MSGSKLQVAMLTGLIVSGAALLQNSVPCLANSAGLLYLRAEYKLLTGDTQGAMRLMQKASQPQVETSPQAKPDSAIQPCPRAAKTQVASTFSRAKARVIAVHLPAMGPGRLETLKVRLPADWAAQHARLMADIEAHTARQNAQTEKAMHLLEARLRNVPVPPAPPMAPSAE